MAQGVGGGVGDALLCRLLDGRAQAPFAPQTQSERTLRQVARMVSVADLALDRYDGYDLTDWLHAHRCLPERLRSLFFPAAARWRAAQQLTQAVQVVCSSPRLPLRGPSCREQHWSRLSLPGAEMFCGPRTAATDWSEG